jgi:hypothetical protein
LADHARSAGEAVGKEECIYADTVTSHKERHGMIPEVLDKGDKRNDESTKRRGTMAWRSPTWGGAERMEEG